MKEKCPVSMSSVMKEKSAEERKKKGEVKKYENARVRRYKCKT
jgi:hypothetical protein